MIFLYIALFFVFISLLIRIFELQERIDKED